MVWSGALVTSGVLAAAAAADMTQVLPFGLGRACCFGRSMIMSAQRRAGRDHREHVVFLDRPRRR